MNLAVFGVVGAYGATGRVVVSELQKSASGKILAGGRDPAKAGELAAQFDSRVTAAQVDVLDSHSLDAFCSQCSIIINCAGPVMLFEDRVAQAALRNHCHYVDVAGLTLVKEGLLPRAGAIVEQGLSFVISAGWMPGVTELLPVHAHAQARAKMDSLESLAVYFSDSGDWSASALRDGVWFLHQLGLLKPGYFRKGQWVRAKMAEASRKVDLGSPIGYRRFSMVAMPELMEVGRTLADCEFRTYSYLSGARNAVAAVMIATLPLPERFGVRLLRNTFRRNRLPVEGFVVAQVIGRYQGSPFTLTERVTFDAGRGYWINGLVPATVARMIWEGKGIQSGVHHLAAAVDPMAFLAELEKSGLTLTRDLRGA